MTTEDPLCGMPLERNPAWVAPAVDHPLYTCPMHPEVKQDYPGSCPKCGVALEPMTLTSGTEEEEHAELHDMTQALLDQRRADAAGVCPGAVLINFSSCC